MAGQHIMVLSSGGLRSLVATALVLREAEKVRATLLHVIDGRDNAVVRMEHVRTQAEHFAIARIVEIDLPHLYGHGHGRNADGTPIGTLIGPQLLVAALAQARYHQAERVIWPTSFNVDEREMARVTEQMVLADHLAQLEGPPMPRLEAPLLELSDQQVVELGGQLAVQWDLAWSCAAVSDKPCRACLSCRRRKAAFDAAGMIDPTDAPRPAELQGVRP